MGAFPAAPILLEHLPADLYGLTVEARFQLAGLAQLDLSTRMPERFDVDERALLAAQLEQELCGLAPHVAVLDAVRALRAPGTTCVVAEALPVLLGGRLEGLYSALTALRLARSLEERGAGRTIAVLCVLADEHEPGDVHPARVVNPNLDLRKIGLPGLGTGRRPYGELVLSAKEHRIPAVRAMLEQLLPDGDERARALELCLPQDGETLARSFTRTLLGLLGEQGLVVVEPEWLRDGLSHGLAELVLAEPDLREHTDAVYGIEDGRRTALRPGGDGWRYDGEPGSRTPAELAARIADAPGAFSAGPAFRALVQAAVLPIRARIAGPPTEQETRAAVAARRLGFDPAGRVPRLSATLVEPETRCALRALALDLRGAFELLSRGGPATQHEAEPDLGPAVAAELRALAERSAAELLGLRERVAEVDRGLAGQLRKVAKELRSPVERLAERAERVGRNQRGGARRHLRRLAAGLRPGGSPQELVLGPLPFLARHGTAWIGALLAELEPRPIEHVVVHLGWDAQRPG